jgi:hypothetical protein
LGKAFGTFTDYGRAKAGLKLLGVVAFAVLWLGCFASAAAAADSVAAFDRIVYGTLPSPTDAAKYQVMAIGYGTTSGEQANARRAIAAIHQAHPRVLILLYKNYTASSSDPQGVGGCAGWNSSKPYGGVPLSWFLKDRHGAPLFQSKFGLYQLDPGNSQVQNACLSSAVSLAKSGGYNGVFWDSINPSLHWAAVDPSNCSSSPCASDANWQAGIQSWVTKESAGLHKQGLLSFGNIGGGAVNYYGGGGSTYWQRYQQTGLDGAEEESFALGNDGKPVPTWQWQQGLANEVWSEANGRYMLGNGDVYTNRALNVYGLATLLLAAQHRSSWDTASGNYTSGEYWFPEYNTALALGAPLGAYTIQANGLYVRHFKNGTVLVNPTTSSINDRFYGQIPAQRGEIL